MHVVPILTAFLANLRKRQTDWGSSAQVTLWTSTPTTYISYHSTAIVTITEWVPCPVTTSYTTTTECSECEEATTGISCLPKSCTVSSGGYIFVSSTPYASDDTAPATVYVNGVGESTEIPASECSDWEPFTSEGCDYSTLPACDCTTTRPVPPGPGCTCQAKPCTVDDVTCCESANAVYATSYGPTEQAPVVNNGATTLTWASYCAAQTSPAGGFNEQDLGSAESCGPDYFGGNREGETLTEGGASGATTITYSYLTNGHTVEAITTLVNDGGAYYVPGAASRMDGGNAHLFFWIWAVVGVVSGTGMIVL